MNPISIALVTASAVIHATWNLLGKRQNPSAAFFLIASGFAALLVVPILFFYRPLLAALPPALWVLLTITGIFQTIYYVGLAGAYRRGDISVAYPLVRALPVIWVTGISAIWQIGKPLNAWGMAGITLVALGCLILPLPGLRELNWQAYRHPAIPLALLAALGTCGYTLIDNQALAMLRGLAQFHANTPASTLLFLALETIATVLVLAVFTLAIPMERERLARTWQNGRSKAALAGVLITTTYGLVLLAMNYASNVSYIVAFRQLSIPLAALLGFIFLKESATNPKLVGISLVFSGLILIGVA